MPDIETTAPESDSDTDAYGNYSHQGDLYRDREPLDELIPRMLAQLHEAFPGYGFAPARSKFAGGRSILMNVISGPAGLDGREAEEAFKDLVLREMRRFERSSGNVLGDHHSCSVYLSVRIDQRYHAQHAEVVEGTEVEKRMSLAEFKRTIKVGDRIVLESTDNEYARTRGAVGVERPVIEVRTVDFIVEEGGKKIHFDFPKAAAFACDGERFRVSDARAGKPGGYRLYRWIRS